MKSETAPVTSEPRPVAILGAGVSGRGAAALCARLGRRTVLFDEVIPGARRDFSETALAEFDTVVVSPGFSPAHPWRRILASGIDRGTIRSDCVFGELGFAMAAWPGKVLAVTGTNGKTTATYLLHAVVKAEFATVRVLLAGNIGISASGVVAGALEEGAAGDDWLICEISSFQADMPQGVALDALAWTNFAPDHIDYHGSEAAYFKAKANLFGCLRGEAPVVLGSGVAESARRFNVALPAGAKVVSDELVPEAAGVLPPESPFAWGPQQMNYGKVQALVNALGLSRETLRRQAATLELPNHRLAKCAEVGGISFWNDSKATNADAALAALRSFDDEIVWIAGGRDKASDLDGFAEAASRELRGVVVTYGAVGERFAEKLRAHGVEVHFYFRLGQAIEAAHALARERRLAHVVLSPGFASYDQFASFADRGKTFVSGVLSLKP